MADKTGFPAFNGFAQQLPLQPAVTKSMYHCILDDTMPGIVCP